MNPAALAAALRGDIANALAASTPGGIERQEAEGQAKLNANFDRLPRAMGHGGRQKLETLGFVFGEDIDDLFVSVQFPEGWSLKATEHSMHSDLLDAQGRRRAGLFYKAAFYDQRADLRLVPRYRVEAFGEYDAEGNTPVQAVDWDGTVLDTFGTYAKGDYDRCDQLEALAKIWLDANRPDWNDAVKSWG